MTNPENRRTGFLLTTATLVMFLLLALLEGCVGDDRASTTGPADGSSVADAAASAPPEELAVATGETIAVEDVDRLPPGKRAFVLPDETRVVVASDEPLPERVRAWVQGQVDRTVQDPGVPGQITTNRSLIVDTAQGIARKVGLQTGKQIVFVYPLVGGCPADSEPFLGWAHTSITLYDAFDCDVLPTREAAEARVAETIAAQKDPERYQVFVRE
ncbi:hypothetical protein EQW78_16565 [Oerskovia turbata]|uniref:Uncharacterized protein n=1 Tax=Oerskovia turbata TaxID=1713 RepID=A0A4Q1KNJ5_9CELL|nr:hypothetical protein [Oerskovia turbata]RXR21775.1 hypothetical protein EQW73_17565 [Oerskovia turbata]RXR31427.1 hypothetical protein EQW78_16565 [Oerskovia turbata]TGJ95968.1 hypothetical protein DLJ96_09300 [Actinotalea fermentans ATCC 43279 = JCM 9966 = DSM 3133]